MQTDATVNPRHDEQQDLLRERAPAFDPGRKQHEPVGRLDAVDESRTERAEQMEREQHRHSEPQQELRPFPGMQEEDAAAVDRPEGQRQVEHQRQGQQRQAVAAPERREDRTPHRFHRCQRDQAERVIGEMRRDIGEKRKAGP